MQSAVASQFGDEPTNEIEGFVSKFRTMLAIQCRPPWYMSSRVDHESSQDGIQQELSDIAGIKKTYTRSIGS